MTTNVVQALLDLLDAHHQGAAVTRPGAEGYVDSLIEAGEAALAEHDAQAPRSIDVERMLAACVPGGSSCDPQQVADAIRLYFSEHDAQAQEPVAWIVYADHEGAMVPQYPPCACKEQAEQHAAMFVGYRTAVRPLYPAPPPATPPAETPEGEPDLLYIVNNYLTGPIRNKARAALMKREMEFDEAVRAAQATPPAAAQPAPSAQGDARWISVKDRLPQKFTEVLVCFAGHPIPSTGQYTDNQRDMNGWCYPVENNGTNDDGTDPTVTHWMPLPEPPIDAAIEAKKEGA